MPCKISPGTAEFISEILETREAMTMKRFLYLLIIVLSLFAGAADAWIIHPMNYNDVVRMFSGPVYKAPMSPFVYANMSYQPLLGDSFNNGALNIPSAQQVAGEGLPVVMIGSGAAAPRMAYSNDFSIGYQKNIQYAMSKSSFRTPIDDDWTRLQNNWLIRS
jgi:hypothetical protein